MKLMPALPESIFDICYLVFAIVSGILLLKKSKGRKYVRIFGIMTLLLGCGDYTAALGIGKLVTSVTMTLFYLLMEYARRDRYKIAGEKGVFASVWILGVIRIALCCFPQNGWTSAEPSLLWGILRNIPFALLGILTVVLWLRSAKNDKPLKLMWLAVTLSFLFYIPVVLFAQTMPMIGMLMLPKTCMYVWMIVMFKKAGK